MLENNVSTIVLIINDISRQLNLLNELKIINQYMTLVIYGV